MNQDNKNHGKRVTLTISIVRDVAALGLIGALLLGLHVLGSPFKRGFHCDDETIRYPHKESTVPATLLHIIGILVNVCLISWFEYLAVREATSSDREPDMTKYLVNVYCRIVVFLFGAAASEFITEIAKFSIGRLRPHFLDVCHPKMSVSGMDYDDYCDSLKDHARYRYITDFTCSGEPHRERDTRLSFMSGHSSYAAYTAGFAVIYLQSAMNGSLFGLTKPFSQVILVSLAFYTGLSRVSDYKHHWQDVLAGLTQGTIVAIIITRFVWPHFYSVYRNYLQADSNHIGDGSVARSGAQRIQPRPQGRVDMETGEELGQIY